MENTDTDTTKHTETDSDDDWEEATPDETLSGNSDTLFQHNDFTDNEHHAIKIAPGEQNHPVSLYLDEYAEEKSFPLLFGGQKRYAHPIKVSYATICKSELRNRDRRFATCFPNIFFILKKLQTEQVKNSITTALRKHRSNRTMTVSDVVNDINVQHIVNENEGYKILRNV